MNKFFWIAAGASLGVGAYILLNNQSNSAYSTADGSSDDLTSGARRFSRKASNWGAGQRVSGTAGQIGGRIKEGLGNIAGDPDTSTAGVADQVIGTAKDTAGKAANAVSNAVDNITR